MSRAISTGSLTQALKISKKIESLENQIGRLEAKLSKTLGKSGKPARKTVRKAVRKAVRRKRKVRGKRRARRSGNSTKQMIAQVLAQSGKAMNTVEILSQLKAKGFKTLSKAPDKYIGVILYTNKKLFKKAGRGKFKIRNAAAAMA